MSARAVTCSSLITKHNDPKISSLGGESLVNNDIHHKSPVKIYKRTNGSLNYLYAIGGPLVVRELDPAKIRNQRVLDVGTGTGATVRDLRKFEIEAEGIDMALSPAQLKKPFFRQERAELMSFEDHRFDLTLSSFSVFYYPELQHVRVQALAEMARVTKSGGRVLLIGFTGYSAKGDRLAKTGRENNNFLGFHNEVEFMSQLWSRSRKAIDAELARILASVENLEIAVIDYDHQVVLLKKK